MLVNIIACGESGLSWDGYGDSIGVNDAFKWGYKLQRLLLLNEPHEFASEPERLAIIKKTNAEFVYTCCHHWNLPNTIRFKDSMWQGKIKPMTIQTSRTSPFCAISLAYTLGYDEIVLYGVDFKGHAIWNNKNNNYHQEIKNYQELASELKNRGVMVYSCKHSVLNLPVYAG